MHPNLQTPNQSHQTSSNSSSEIGCAFTCAGPELQWKAIRSATHPPSYFHSHCSLEAKGWIKNQSGNSLITRWVHRSGWLAKTSDQNRKQVFFQTCYALSCSMRSGRFKYTVKAAPDRLVYITHSFITSCQMRAHPDLPAWMPQCQFIKEFQQLTLRVRWYGAMLERCWFQLQILLTITIKWTEYY